MDLIITTPEDLKAIVKECLQEQKEYRTKPVHLNQSTPDDDKITSMKGLATFLGCSVVKAQDAKNKGFFRYRQFGRKVLFLKSEILEDLQKLTTQNITPKYRKRTFETGTQY